MFACRSKGDAFRREQLNGIVMSMVMLQSETTLLPSLLLEKRALVGIPPLPPSPLQLLPGGTALGASSVPLAELNATALPGTFAALAREQVSMPLTSAMRLTLSGIEDSESSNATRGGSTRVGSSCGVRLQMSMMVKLAPVGSGGAPEQARVTEGECVVTDVREAVGDSEDCAVPLAELLGKAEKLPDCDEEKLFVEVGRAVLDKETLPLRDELAVFVSEGLCVDVWLVDCVAVVLPLFVTLAVVDGLVEADAESATLRLIV